MKEGYIFSITMQNLSLRHLFCVKVTGYCYEYRVAQKPVDAPERRRNGAGSADRQNRRESGERGEGACSLATSAWVSD
jgi:hypothetical protein